MEDQKPNQTEARDSAAVAEAEESVRILRKLQEAVEARRTKAAKADAWDEAVDAMIERGWVLPLVIVHKKAREDMRGINPYRPTPSGSEAATDDVSGAGDKHEQGKSDA